MVEKIKALCKEKEISLATLEKALEFSANSIRKWDDHSPSFDKVVMVAEYFGILVDELKKEE